MFVQAEIVDRSESKGARVYRATRARHARGRTARGGRVVVLAVDEPHDIGRSNGEPFRFRSFAYHPSVPGAPLIGPAIAAVTQPA